MTKYNFDVLLTNLESVYCSKSSSNCCFLTCIQVSKEFSTVCYDPHSQSLGIVNETEVDVFLEFPSFFYNPTNIGNLISGSSVFSKSSLYVWKFSVHELLKPICRILSTTLLACEMRTIVRQFEHSLALPFFWIGMKTDLFQSCHHC